MRGAGVLVLLVLVMGLTRGLAMGTHTAHTETGTKHAFLQPDSVQQAELSKHLGFDLQGLVHAVQSTERVSRFTPCHIGEGPRRREGECRMISECTREGRRTLPWQEGASGCEYGPSDYQCCLFLQPCSYQRQEGQCLPTQTCQRHGGIPHPNARGCEMESADAQCCVSSPTSPNATTVIEPAEEFLQEEEPLTYEILTPDDDERSASLLRKVGVLPAIEIRSSIEIKIPLPQTPFILVGGTLRFDAHARSGWNFFEGEGGTVVTFHFKLFEIRVVVSQELKLVNSHEKPHFWGMLMTFTRFLLHKIVSTLDELATKAIDGAIEGKMTWERIGNPTGDRRVVHDAATKFRDIFLHKAASLLHYGPARKVFEEYLERMDSNPEGGDERDGYFLLKRSKREKTWYTLGIGTKSDYPWFRRLQTGDWEWKDDESGEWLPVSSTHKPRNNVESARVVLQTLRKYNPGYPGSDLLPTKLIAPSAWLDLQRILKESSLIDRLLLALCTNDWRDLGTILSAAWERITTGSGNMMEKCEEAYGEDMRHRFGQVQSTFGSTMHTLVKDANTWATDHATVLDGLKRLVLAMESFYHFLEDRSNDPDLSRSLVINSLLRIEEKIHWGLSTMSQHMVHEIKETGIDHDVKATFGIDLTGRAGSSSVAAVGAGGFARIGLYGVLLHANPEGSPIALYSALGARLFGKVGALSWDSNIEFRRFHVGGEKIRCTIYKRLGVTPREDGDDICPLVMTRWEGKLSLATKLPANLAISAITFLDSALTRALGKSLTSFRPSAGSEAEEDEEDGSASVASTLKTGMDLVMERAPRMLPLVLRFANLLAKQEIEINWWIPWYTIDETTYEDSSEQSLTLAVPVHVGLAERGIGWAGKLLKSLRLVGGPLIDLDLQFARSFTISLADLQSLWDTGLAHLGLSDEEVVGDHPHSSEEEVVPDGFNQQQS